MQPETETPPKESEREDLPGKNSFDSPGPTRLYSVHTLTWRLKTMAAIQIAINKETCTACGTCVEVIPRCIEDRNGEITPIADEKTCILCGRCVAVCPTESITHRTMDMKNFPEVSKTPLISSALFKQFIRERRSHRAFLDKKVPKETLEELIDTVRYAPSGHNDQSVEILLIQDGAKRKRASDLVVDFMGHGRAKVAADLEKLKESGNADPAQVDEMEGTLEFLGVIAQARDEGQDPILYDAPAVVVFHSAAKSITPKDNCMIAATTMGLYARTFGLETTYIGLFEPAANLYEPLKNELVLPTGHKVFSVLVMGYPKVEYVRAVDRKPVKTRWE
jgi:nitroreductase/NAD-dependent dihydropyrimidine dehydrogenase PreA subunit